MASMRILVINPGATSTKVSVFEDENEVFKKVVDHPAADLAPFERIIDQREYRRGLILDLLAESGYRLSGFSAVCGRGGLLRHLASGTYAVTDRVLYDIEHPLYGEHASNLGPVLAKELADSVGIPAFLVDPVSVDEMDEVARVTGFKGMQRESFFHALNHKSIARKAARQLGKAYEELNLVIAHMGGGVSIAAHRKGRVVDMFNVKDDGSFSMDRGGNLPTTALVNYCFSGKTKEEVKKTLGYQAGVYSYLGTRDFREVEARMAAGDKEAALVFEAMVYQHCKDIGAMVAVLSCEVDAIVLTGGIANSKKLCDAIKGRVGKLAPIMVLPGEEEMRSLAEGALRVLRGQAASVY